MFIKLRSFIPSLYLSAVITFFLFSNTSLEAANYYVNNSHPRTSDTNPGTKEAPWATIQHGVNIAEAGDTVFVSFGIYNEGIVLKRSGNANTGYIVFIGIGEKKPIIDGTGKSDKLIDWKGKPDGGFQKNYIIFDGFEIRNASRWAFWIQGDHNIIRNCKIHNTGHTAIQLITGSYNIISNNEIYNTGWNAISWESNNGGTGIRTDYNIIEHNYIHDILHHNAINGFPNEKAGNLKEYGGVGNVVRFNIIKNCLQGIYVRYEKEMEIYGNLITDIFGYQGIHFHASSKESSATYLSNSKVYNNVIANCKQNGIFNANALNLDIKNNIFYNNSSGRGFYDIEFKPRTAGSKNEIDYNLYFN